MNRGFSWKIALSGGVIGIIVACIAHLLDASPWWWLAVPIGFCSGTVSLRLDASAKWGNK